MGPQQLSAKFRQWSSTVGTAASFIGAAVMLVFVIVTYLERDVVRIRGVVLSLVLIGLGLIVKSEAHVSIPVHRSRH